MRRLRKCLHKGNIVLTSATIVSSALLFHAVQADDNFNKRFYVGGGVGLSDLQPESPVESLRISDGKDVGLHLGVGFDVNRFLSVEAYAATLGQAEVEFLGADAGDVDYTVFGLSAVGYLFNSRSGLVLGDEDMTGLFRRQGASVYGRIGFGHMQNDSSRVNYKRVHPNHAAVGLGVEYGFNNGLALRSEIMSLDTDAQYFNVGILKRFGKSGAALPIAAAALPIAAADLPVAAEQNIEPAAALPALSVIEPIKFKAVQSPFIYFEVDGSTLSPESAQKLDEFAVLLADNDLELRVEGHTDWLAAEAYNMSLSERRAETVANYLVSKGIQRQRLSSVGYGETRPISSNNTDEGRALNRRAEIILP